jgi:hypothetical protein
MKYLLRFLLLTVAFALTTAGLMGWHDRGFGFDGVWALGLWSSDSGLQLHPLHLVIIGLPMIPPALWEIFLLERAGQDARDATAHEPERVGGGPT